MSEVEIFRLSETARSFATRSKGQEMAKSFASTLANAKGGEIVLDWSGVTAASPSFIDEFIAGMQEVARNEIRSKTIVFAGDNPEIIDRVDTILKRREFPVQYTLRPEDVEGHAARVLGDRISSPVVPA